MKKVVVTGGAGFIGSHIAELLVNKGYHVVIIDNFAKSEVVSQLTPPIMSHRAGFVVPSIYFKITLNGYMTEVIQNNLFFTAKRRI